MALTKVCCKCKIAKPVSEFYPHKRDGLRPYCKPCHREDNRGYGKEHQSYYAEYRLRPEVKRRNRELQKIRLRDPERHKELLARRRARAALKWGSITRKDCAVCGSIDSGMHHPNYDRPLDITWLCKLHHTEEHKRLFDSPK